MNEEISKLIARNKQLKSLLDDCQKKNTLLKETLSHSILELNNANVKHNERIALMEKEIIAANDIAQETDALNQKQKEMTLKYQKQIANYVLDRRISQKLENISMHAMNVKILNKLNIAHDQFLPDQLEEDINRIINKHFSDNLFKLAESSYARALSHIASVSLSKYLFNKPCIWNDLIAQLTHRIDQRDECHNECMEKLHALHKALDESNTLEGLASIDNKRIIQSQHFLKLEVNAANGLLSDTLDALNITMEEKLIHLRHLASNTGFTERCFELTVATDCGNAAATSKRRKQTIAT